MVLKLTFQDILKGKRIGCHPFYQRNSDKCLNSSLSAALFIFFPLTNFDIIYFSYDQRRLHRNHVLIHVNGHNVEPDFYVKFAVGFPSIHINR